MKDIRKPPLFKEALYYKDHGMLREVLTAFLLFFIGTFLGSFVQMPVMLVYFSTNRDYLNMISSGTVDNKVIMEMISNMPDWVMALALCGTAGTVIATCFYYKVIEKKALWCLGFRKEKVVRSYISGIFLGICVMTVCYLLGAFSGALTIDFAIAGKKAVPVILLFFAGYMIQGLAEEVLCRGFLFIVLTKRYPVYYALLLSSLFYALLHGFHSSLSFLGYFNFMLFGVFMGLLFIQCENIWLVGAFHGILDFIVINVFGEKGGGLKESNFIFSVKMTEEASLLTGGEYGMIGGLLMTAVLVLSIIVLLLLMYRRKMFVPIEENQVRIELPESEQVFVEKATEAELYPPLGMVDEVRKQADEDTKKRSVFDRNYFKD